MCSPFVVVNLAYPLTEKNWKKEKAKRHPEMALVIAVAHFSPGKISLGAIQHLIFAA